MAVLFKGGNRGEPVESTDVTSKFETHDASMEDAPYYDCSRMQRWRLVYVQFSH